MLRELSGVKKWRWISYRESERERKIKKEK